jgi:hypothetical protein
MEGNFVQQTRSNEQCVDYTIINYRTLSAVVEMNLIDFNDQLSWKSESTGMGNYFLLLEAGNGRGQYRY